MFAVCSSTAARGTPVALARRSCAPAKCRAAGAAAARQQRGSGPAAAANYASVAPSAPVRVAGAFGGVKVVSADDGASDACVLSIALPAGARHQRVGESGLAHHHKNWAFTGTFTNTALAITREAEIHGGSLTSNLTREALFLTAEFHRKDLYVLARFAL
ncbi:MAG: hypothetical protein BJ554DRAFT_3226 [Olpidium bornovanus]|uniref:Peptidase M16 N-terminal domain-containing protein n=1 Tax=Olpidium bornovanus TaxID=278681 RepID=A0A8H7ZPC9_9FUNG|nr:MAG: hypothetical protein BJ554DRAFT_3226 [Olpidium bornovanus]